MKHLREYLPVDYGPYFSVRAIFGCIAQAVAEGASGVLMDKEEMTYFQMAYDSILPYDWDRRTFRGLRFYTDKDLIVVPAWKSFELFEPYINQMNLEGEVVENGLAIKLTPKCRIKDCNNSRRSKGGGKYRGMCKRHRKEKKKLQSMLDQFKPPVNA